MDDWYKLTADDMSEYGGITLLHLYNNSPSKALQSVYPEHKWMIWRFKTMPHGYLNEPIDSTEVTRMLDWLGEHLSIKNLEDWYRVSMKQLRKWIPITSSKDLCKMLQIAFPQHQWNTEMFGSFAHVKASQKLVVYAIQQLFPTHSTCTLCFKY